MLYLEQSNSNITIYVNITRKCNKTSDVSVDVFLCPFVFAEICDYIHASTPPSSDSSMIFGLHGGFLPPPTAPPIGE